MKRLYPLLVILFMVYWACEDKQEKDCAGIEGGTAMLDSCGICIDGTTNTIACTQDCANVWGGTATVDNCNQCAGGNTGIEACTEDCNGDFGGTATMDNCNQCDINPANDCTADCATNSADCSSSFWDGTYCWGGSAEVDNCDNCVGGNTGIEACTEDCNGDWGGAGLVDCSGVCDGDATMDNCNQCAGGNTGIEACTEDCAGEWGGDAVEDCAGECGGGLIVDCAGVCNGTTQPEDCTVTDIDGNMYQNVQIGDQLWMAENLKTTHYNNGDAIPTGYSNEEWSELGTGAYGVYFDNGTGDDFYCPGEDNYSVCYGNLYNGYAIADIRGVCPSGWRIPTNDDYQILKDYVGGYGQGQELKDVLYWYGGWIGSNAFGFSGRPGGKRLYNGGYDKAGYYGYFWSTSENWILSYDTPSFYNQGVSDKQGSSCRCIKD